MTDDDLFRLFLNLCNARAIDNLDLSETYIKDELVPLYAGPHGSIQHLSQHSQHNVQHFQENLRLLRELMLVLNKLTGEIKLIRDELDDLLLTHHRVAYPHLFNPNERIELFWPTPHPAAERDRARVDTLLQDYQEKSEQVKHLITSILMLIREDPFLTQFIVGLEISEKYVDVPNRTAVEATLADIQDPAKAQQQILEKLDGILKSIARAREKLCLDPERVLDVPLVYQKVQELLAGTNERFDTVVRERIAHHQQLKQWIDIGLGAAGLVLFVGGLILSAFGGPAGVGAYLGFAGTALGAVITVRSIDEAIFKTALSEASVEQGRGLETLEAAQTARIWAWVNSTLLAVDVAASGVRSIVAARRVAALAKLSKGAEVFEESVQAGKRIPFEDIFNQAKSRSQILINQAELAQLRAPGTGTGDLGRIAEEVTERVVFRSGEYVKLATKVHANQGIDLVFVRRKIFEEIFGKLANPLDASRILAQATDGQMQQLLKALERASSIEDIIAAEVKFTRVGASVEDLLKTARGVGGVQYNRQWFQGLLPEMLRAADPEVQATGRLLENIIGTNAQNIDRLARVGISLDPNGVFRLIRLNDDIINTARQIRPLFWRNWRIINRMIEAGRTGNPAEAERLLNVIRDITRRIDALDAAINQAKRGLAASQRTLKSLEVASQSLNEVKALQAAKQTPAVINLLHIATATARLHLEVVRYSTDEGESEYRQAIQSNNEALQKHQEFQAEATRLLDELEKIEPGAKERIVREADDWVKSR
jgi:exonuclease VII small subunit